MICGKTELCIFDRPSPQAVIESGTFEDVFPMNSISESQSDLEFLINGSQTEYLDLNDTLLYIKVKVVDKDGKDLIATDDSVPSNYMLHTLFKDVILSFNNFKIEGGNESYHHKALIETIINYNGDSKNICLTAMGYGPEADRKTSIALSKQLSLCGSLQLDFMDQPKYLIPGVNVHIRLKRASPQICLESAANSPKYVLLDAKLIVRRVRVEPSVLAGHLMGLKKQNAIYPIRTKEVVAFAISKDSSSFYKEQIFSDRRLPSFLLVAFQSDEQYNGGYKSSSSTFQHLDAVSVSLTKNTDYREIYTQDFAKDNYTTSYMQSIVRNMGYLDKNMNCGITLKDFKDNYPFFTFVLAPDFDINQSQLPQQGNLRLDIKFAKALTASAYVIIYGVFENEIQIKENGSILV